MTEPVKARRAQLFRLYEGALRRSGATEQIRWELRTLGVSVPEIHTFKIAVRRRMREERET